MNWQKKIQDLHNANKSILDAAKATEGKLTDDQQTAFDANMAEIDNCKRMIENEKKMGEIENSLKSPVNSDVQVIKNEPLFKNFVDQLAAIKKSTETGIKDERLEKIQNATGMSTGVGSDGGFAVQSDFAGMMLESAVKDSPILSLVDTYQVSGGSRRVNWVDIDEDDISTTVFGGVQVYRAAEAAAVTASKPKIKEKELKLEKLMGLAYATFELDTSSSFVSELYTRAFTAAIRRKLEEEIITGDGVGRCLGILNAGGLVTVAKESGQTNYTVLWKNISKMYHRALDRIGGRWVWLMNPDAHEQLDYMEFPVGTGGAPVFTPANLTGTIDTLRALPVVSTDQCSALGSAGDIILADMADYFMAVKGGVQADASIHVAFLTAENAFRFIFEANGRPKRTSKLTIKNSSTARGKYIALGVRS